MPVHWSAFARSALLLPSTWRVRESIEKGASGGVACAWPIRLGRLNSTHITDHTHAHKGSWVIDLAATITNAVSSQEVHKRQNSEPGRFYVWRKGKAFLQLYQSGMYRISHLRPIASSLSLRRSRAMDVQLQSWGCQNSVPIAIFLCLPATLLSLSLEDCCLATEREMGRRVNRD